MKRILAILLTIFLCATATAQITNSIVLDRSTFRAVQSDALTGVNIDPIGVDRSRRQCARLKIFFHRMTREQMAQLEPVFPSGTIDYPKCKVAEGNTVLILEFTARPQVQFYLKHPTFGTSNEVTFDYEGNKEYQMEASLNQTFSIVVNSNVAGADVYLDGEYKGKTDSTNSLTVKDVMIGAHNLKLQYGSVTNEQSIEVNDSCILFRQDVNTAANKPQYVVFTVEPKNSAVTIDGQLYVAEDGVVVALLQSGQHTYKAEARGYHSQSGTITVSGAKIERTITLKEDFATVTLTVDSGADIYVNDKKVGTTTWSGRLNSGLYIFEARKSGYRTQSITRQITSDPASQSYTLPALVPIYGSADITSSPAMADITLDGKSVGRTPLQLDNLLIGEHKITVSKSGYQPYSATVTVAEGKTATVSAELIKGKIYKVGDYYNENGKQGVVFEVSADGRSGKIVSMKQAYLLWSSDSAEQKRLIGANSETNGAYNMAKVKAIYGWQSKYPAFARCADLGEGWYLPSKEELITIYKNKDKVNSNLTDKLSSDWYWSSTESNYQSSLDYFCACNVKMSDGYTHYNFKYASNCVRAVFAFGNSSNAVSVATTSAPYKVGDYYNDGVKEGVVFEVSADGRHGKIVSMKRSAELLEWSSDSAEQKRLIGANSETNGAYNMAKVKAIYGWQSKYPAFKWCADLGEGWYLPSIEELKAFTINDTVRNAVSRTLKAKGGEAIYNKGDSYKWYWSSTESSGKHYDYFCACYVNVYVGDPYDATDKRGDLSVRAVSAFGDSSKTLSAVTIVSNRKTTAPYKVGDYYNDGVKEGVVFEVSADGRHGKIVSMKQSATLLKWSSDRKEQKRRIGARSETDGAVNMAKVKARSNWRDKYPAFRWCADLGEGWYLPSKEELRTIYKNKDKLNPKLTGELSSLYWSSTEEDYKYSSGEFCAWSVNMGSGYTYNFSKDDYYYVRAVSAF